MVFCIEWDLWFFLDGGEIFVIINDFQFTSNTSNFIGFELNLNLVEFLKVIQHPDFHWIWIETHDTLGNVSKRKNNTHMYLESYKNLQGFSLCYISNIYFWDW
jgi:hypothetical protein